MRRVPNALPADLAAADFEELLSVDGRQLDVRAPVECSRGSVPCATQLPLLQDDERARVGTLYHEAGHDAAIALGHTLVHGPVRDARMQAWLEWCDAFPDGAIFCARGGDRSKIVQRWLADTGRPRPRIAGGYKALRAYFLATLETCSEASAFFVVGGHTGSGKTALLTELPRHLDLEGLAQHRGSAFGARLCGQPALATFENAIALRILRLARAASDKAIAVEDEGRNIGRLTIPAAVHSKLAEAPIALLEVPLEERVQTTLRAYIVEACHEHQALLGEGAGFESFARSLTDALGRIQKRLGGDRFRKTAKLLEDALRIHRERADVEGHRDWIRSLLQDYYDPRYEYQLAAQEDRIALRGDADTVRAFLLEQTS